jgi:selenocysteine lyase/cysteine desulfurase
MHSRRAFLRLTGVLGGTALAAEARLAAGAADLEAVQAATAAVADRTPEAVAADKFYWREIQQAFTLDRTIINLNNGNSCPSPRVVHDAYKRYLDYSNQVPVYHRTLLERNIETVRRRLAQEFGCDIEEMAITRNSSESLQIAQNGLDLQPGDEVLTTEQDYPRMLTTWDQRARRDEIVIKRINFPVPTTQDDLYERLAAAITPRTKVLHFCHITNLTGQLFPVQRLSRLARERGIVTIVDGAHAVAHFPFKLRELECDYYGTSLHKWLLAPVGTGFLYVRRERVARTWPLQAAPARRDNDIRKFEEIGTSPAATKAAINEAIAFHQAIGAERKAARLHYLTRYWADRLSQHPRVKLHSSLEQGQVWGVACVGIEGMDPAKISNFMWDKYRIVVNAVGREDAANPRFTYSGLRVTPNVYTPLEELDTFVMAMEDLLKNGLPASVSSGWD